MGFIPNKGAGLFKPLAVLFPLTLSLVIVSCANQPAPNDRQEVARKTKIKNPPESNASDDKMDLDSHSWMAKLPDSISLASLNIPGTHNSGALHEPFPRTAKCQQLSIIDQLKIGVRFLDIRCRHVKDRFFIYHGPINQRLSFEAVLGSIYSFLESNQSETLIISIKEENSATQTTRPFTETLHWYIDKNPDKWLLKEAVPNLGEARGKIALLRRFRSAKPFGIPATNWGHDGFFVGSNLFVQDKFKIPDNGTKWKIMQKAFEHSLKDSSSRFHLHFGSGYTQNRLGIPNITAISDPINKKLSEYLKKAPKQRHGCVVLDFINPDLAEAIYKLNFTSD